jgi:hypothetical protein
VRAAFPQNTRELCADPLRCACDNYDLSVQ